jgi:FixJ family two-component response regulator
MDKAVNERNAEASAPAPIKIAVIDDEQLMRTALPRLMRSAGIGAAIF